MDIKDSVALVTGANRGLGRAFTQELLDRGARKVYAASRQPKEGDYAGLDTSRLEVLQLDITNQAQVSSAVAKASDVTVLINNAGTNSFANLIDGDLEVIRAEIETHVFGTLGVTRGFAPVLAGNGGGALLNVLSAMSWFGFPGDNSYHLAKAAEWALTNAVRLELAEQGTLVVGVHLGAADTDMSAGYDGEKISPASVARASVDGIEAGAWEVIVDEWTANVKAALSGEPAPFYTGMMATLGIPLRIAN
jgi:NAD(P)-dependent dehydrogenase (short-subunit alcohol dehydrogenase family)